MPGINRIRVNNVKYNFGTQFYDDFIMRFDGKNALYDLANGGGKSVLLLLLLQNLIPNCTLDDKQPLEKLFRTGDGSTSIHSLIEWKLDDVCIQDGYKYMLTGFCARKAKDDSMEDEKIKHTASIDYFNYIIFYRSYNDNDIVNLPLSKGGERLTYTGLRVYLKEIERKDSQLKVAVFDRKGEYQRAIEKYGLYESQWEIIRGINKTEGHVRTYFESNYRTTRKVVEDLLIGEIIQKAFAHKAGGSDSDIAQTLLNIKDRLVELSKRKEEISAYDGQINALESFMQRISILSRLYEREEVFKKDLVKTYRTIQNILRLKENEMNLYEKETALADKRIIEAKRKTDTAKVQQSLECLAKMEADTNDGAMHLQTLEKEYASQMYALSEAQSMNDYLEYKETVHQAEIIKKTIENSGQGHEDLLDELRRTAFLGRQTAQAEIKRLKSEIAKDEQEKADWETDITSVDGTVRENDRRIAVLEHAQRTKAREIQDCIGEAANLRKQVNALLIEGSLTEIRTYRQKVSQKKQQIADFQEEIRRMSARRHALEIQAGKLESAQQMLQSMGSVSSEFMTRYLQEKEHIDRLMYIYKAEHMDHLKHVIAQRYEKASAELYLYEKDCGTLTKYMEQLEEHNPVTVSSGVSEAVNYLRSKHHASCMAGSDYLKDIEKEEKAALLERLPFLPYTVIVMDKAGSVFGDRVFKETDFGGFAIPVMRIEAVENGEKVLSGDQIFLAGCPSALYTNEAALEQKKNQTKSRLEAIEKDKHRLQDQMKTYMTDLESVFYFVKNYEDVYQIKQNEAQQLKKRTEENQQLQQQCACEIQQLKEDSAKTQAALERAQADYEETCKESEVVEKIARLMKKIEEDKKSADRDRIEKDRLSEEAKALLQKKEGLQASAEKIKVHIDCMKSEADELAAMIRKDFLVYLPSDGAAVKIQDSGEKIEDIHARFMGLKAAYEEKNADLSDKRRLLENYEKTMERLKEAVETRNIDFKTLEAKAQAKNVAASDGETIKKYKTQADKLAEDIRLTRAIQADALAGKNKLMGSVENSKQVIEERYGFYKEVDLKDRDYDTFFKEYDEIIVQLQQRREAMIQSAAVSEKEFRAADELKKEIERIIQMLKIPYHLTDESYKPDLDIKKKTDALLKTYRTLCLEEDVQKTAFDKAKESAAEALVKCSAAALAHEVRTGITLPTTCEEAQQLSENISETENIIRLEKTRVLQGIESMEKMKENFVVQCVQRCMDIKMELDRFEGMSKIVLDHKKIQMVRLKVPYVQESLFEQKMSEYISQTAMEADQYSNPDERLSFIRSKLAWKNLFAVIVDDMDAIRLSLYKRERMKEQSRFLKYEEAVGSTGQSQGIYIQFLIALIHYISAINAGNADSTDLKNVIFIDNPFGAAKDVYIWEPIFEMLKENHVQLIVPARGATPAVTGKFDVVYMLGQKLTGHCQQTVIVDYRSYINTEETEYKKIEFEQEVFDFI